MPFLPSSPSLSSSVFAWFLSPLHLQFPFLLVSLFLFSPSCNNVAILWCRVTYYCLITVLRQYPFVLHGSVGQFPKWAWWDSLFSVSKSWVFWSLHKNLLLSSSGLQNLVSCCWCRTEDPAVLLVIGQTPLSALGVHSRVLVPVHPPSLHWRASLARISYTISLTFFSATNWRTVCF